MFENTEKKPKIIVFEGVDGAGKTTQIKMLKKFFEKYNFSYYQTREPGGSPVAEKIRKLFLGSSENLSLETQILLCSAARKEHLDYLQEMQRIHQYDFIIFDRFIDSTIAYQILPNKMNPDILYNLNRKFKINLKIDLAILLDIDPAYSFERRNKKYVNHFDQNIGFLKKVRQSYLRMWRKSNGIYMNNVEKRIMISSNTNSLFVHQKIVSQIKDQFQISTSSQLASQISDINELNK